MAGEIRLPDIGDFKDVPIIEILVKPGQSVAKEDVADDARKRQGDARSAGAGGRRHRRNQGQGRRQGEPRRAARDLGVRRRGERAGARRPTGRGVRRRDRAGRFRMRRAGARRRSRRLFRRLPRRRSRRQRGAGRSSADARRRLPQRRLHPVEGAAPRRQGHRRGGRDVRPRPRLRAAEDRSRRFARLEGAGGQAPDDRPYRPRASAQGDGADRRRGVHLAAHAGGEGGGGRPRGAFQPRDHRRRLGARRARLHSARSAHLGFDRRARAALHPQAPAGARRRHHRPGDGDGLQRARARRSP